MTVGDGGGGGGRKWKRVQKYPYSYSVSVSDSPRLLLLPFPTLTSNGGCKKGGSAHPALGMLAKGSGCLGWEEEWKMWTSRTQTSNCNVKIQNFQPRSRGFKMGRVNPPFFWEKYPGVKVVGSNMKLATPSKTALLLPPTDHPILPTHSLLESQTSCQHKR